MIGYTLGRDVGWAIQTQGAQITKHRKHEGAFWRSDLDVLIGGFLVIMLEFHSL